MPLQFSDLYNGAARWAGDTSTTGVSRARDAVVEANKQLSYGLQLPLLRPWWRKREDTITPVAGTQTYAFPTAQGTMESLHKVWYRSAGQRFDIDLVDDDRWHEEANEDTTQQGTPDICNLHASSGTTHLRFSLTPSTAFINAIVGGVIRMDFFILETLVATSGDTTEPLMPDSRRWGIVWKAVEFLAGMQGDNDLLLWAAAQGKRYYEMLLADDIGRVGDTTRIIQPIEAIGERNPADRLIDYGHGD